MSDEAAAQTMAGILFHLNVVTAIGAVSKLRIPDFIDDVPRSAEELAAAVGGHALSIGRVLKLLASEGVFIMEGDRFGHTDLSRVLRSDHPLSQRGFAAMRVGPSYAAFGRLADTLLTGANGFEAHYGMNSFEYFERNPEYAAEFGEAMSSITVRRERDVLSACAFEQFALAVDVGGSRGAMMRGLLAKYPDARGIVFDLPGAVEAGRPGWEGSPEGPRMQGVGGSFFKSVPPGGDLYILKSILHDWEDEQCLAILQVIRAAMAHGARLAIIEMVLPEEPVPHVAWTSDISMLALTGGRERTLTEYQALLANTGFTFQGLTPTRSASVIEAVAAG